MVRSSRGLGPVLLALLVLAPLTLFALVALVEVEPADPVGLSLDGVAGDTERGGALLATRKPWAPGEVRSTIVYVRNRGEAPVDADVRVVCRSSDELVQDGHLTLTAQVGQAEPTKILVGTSANLVTVEDLASDSVVPMTLTATLSDTVPIGTTLDSDAVRFRLTVTDTRSQVSGASSVLNATGAQLWLAPVLLVIGGVLLVVQAFRRRRSPVPTIGR